MEESKVVESNETTHTTAENRINLLTPEEKRLIIRENNRRRYNVYKMDPNFRASRNARQRRYEHRKKALKESQVLQTS